MRASEFLNEYGPAQLINKTVDVGGIKLSINADGANVSVYALADSRQLGYVVFDRDGNTLVADDLAIEERYKGQGIAQLMYDYVRDLGFKIRRSHYQTDAGKNFWDKNKGQDSEVWEDELTEISRDRLERYLDRANRQVDTRQERMARARQRLNTSYEIYHAENPTKIVDRFEADTPADAQRYYQDYIANYVSDVDYDLRLRKSTGLGEELEEGIGNWLAGIATVGALIFGAGDANALTQQQYDQTARILSSTPAQILKQVAVKSGITGNELAQFMAQCAHETAGFTSMKEIGGSRDFKKYDIKHNPRKAKALGNVKPGDGARYHGRGYIQLTGRDNYKRAGQALGLPLEQNPELVERPDVAAKVAVWFWKSRVQPKVASYHDTRQVTKPINPAMRGLKDREAKFQAIKQGAMVRSNQLAPRGTKI